MEEDIKLGKNIQEFEEIFGNVPIKDLEKIREYIKRDYIPKSKVREKIEEIQNRRIKDGECELALHGFQREAKIEALEELLQEGDK